MAFFYDKITIFVPHLKTYLYIALFLLVTIIFVSCKQEHSHNSSNQKEIQFSDFEKLPQHPFLTIDFSLTTQQNKGLLKANQFDKTNQGFFEREMDSTIVIFEEDENLTAFKVYLKSHFYITNNQLLYDFLAQHSTVFSGDNLFAEMKFNTSEFPFSLTYFTTQNQIRIHFIKQ